MTKFTRIKLIIEALKVKERIVSKRLGYPYSEALYSCTKNWEIVQRRKWKPYVRKHVIWSFLYK